jgi:ribosome-associated GTPase EngA
MPEHDSARRPDPPLPLRTARDLPHSLESEQAVLGAILSDDTAFDQVAATLQPRDFYRLEHQHVYEACVELAKEAKTLDAVMVQQRLDAKGLLGGAVPRELPFVLQRAVGLTANVGHYARGVKELSSLRNMMLVAQGLVERGYEAGTSVQGFLEAAQQEVFTAAQGVGNETLRPIKEPVWKALEKLEAVQQRVQSGQSPITGVPTLPLAPPAPEEAPEPEEVTEDERPRGDVRLAVVGRPNVGKSTFVNALLREERFVVSEVPGTTRDAIDSIVEHRGKRFVVTDTAGIRRKRSIALKVEAFSVIRAMRAIDDAEVVACLLDATEAGVEQDARLLGIVAEKGKALVVVVNKWDIAEREGATQDWYRKELFKRLPFVAFAPMVFVSAKERRGVTKVLDQAQKLVEQYRARFPTPQLNELIASVQVEHPAPLARGHPVKLFYAAQVGYAPPTFVIQCSRPEAIGDAYRRFIENRIREAFGLETPMRLVFKERKRRRRPPPGARS